MAEAMILSAAIGAGGTALPWLSTAGSLASIASAGGVAGTIASAAPYVSLISTGLSGASALSQVAGGYQESAVYKAQARQSELSARQEELRGRDQADKIRRSLQATLASQRAGFAARGISPGSGTPVALGNISRTEAASDIETAMFGSQMAGAQERGQAAQYRLSGRSAVTKGYGGAASSLIKAYG